MKNTFRKYAKRLVPFLFVWSKQLKNFRILSKHFAQFRTIRDWECVDSRGQQIPWYTYPATEFLRQLDFSSKTVFEYGSGNSTIFWSKICKNITSVEDNKEWFDKISNSISENVTYAFKPDKSEYVNLPIAIEKKFDVIIIDGSHRAECAAVGARCLKDDGFIILDNSDWYEETSKFLRGNDFIEIDMSGFGPINNYTWTTSIFLRRGVDLCPRADRQPKNSIGSLINPEASRLN